MNKKQAESLKMNTCGLIQRVECYVDQMEEHGMPKKELDKINELVGYILKLNQKYVRLSK